ncbi:MAG: FAD-dependent oxidoreductase [bacterium]
MTDSNDIRDVLVVGAGVSGLTTAHILGRHGIDVEVVEARDRVGGRTWSPMFDDVRLDLGATWVWDHESHVHALIGELGLQTYIPTVDGDDLYDTPMGVQRVRLPGSSVQERRIVGGTQAISLALAKGLSCVTLNTSVTAVRLSDDSGQAIVEVETSAGTRRARHVVAALPSSLFASQVDLPNLDPERLRILRATPTWMGDIAKFVAVYERPFWRDQGLCGRGFSRVGPIGELHDISVPGGDHGVLFGFIPRVDLPVEALKDRALEQLARMFGPVRPTHHIMKVWWTDAMTVAPNPHATMPGLLGHPVLREPLLDGRLHLSSTECATENAGHLDGAVQRAREVAHMLRRLLT